MVSMYKLGTESAIGIITNCFDMKYEEVKEMSIEVETVDGQRFAVTYFKGDKHE